MSIHKHNKIKYHKILINVTLRVFLIREIFIVFKCLYMKITYMYKHSLNYATEGLL